MWICGREGEVIYWNSLKGYGFVRDTEGYKYFVSYTDILAPSDIFRSLEVGQKVRFCSNHPATGDNKATEVEKIE